MVAAILAALEAARAEAEASPATATVRDEAAAAVGGPTPTTRIKVVSLPTVHWQDGSLLDLFAIGKAVRSIGAYFVVDGTQSVGAVPFDVAEVQPDFMCASAYKWLLCPYGLTFLYAAPGHCQAGAPLEHHNWERSGGSFYKYDFNPGARRYDSDFKMMNFVFKMMNSVFNMMNSVFKMTNSVFKMMNSVFWSEATTHAEGEGEVHYNFTPFYRLLYV